VSIHGANKSVPTLERKKIKQKTQEKNVTKVNWTNMRRENTHQLKRFRYFTLALALCSINRKASFRGNYEMTFAPKGKKKIIKHLNTVQNVVVGEDCIRAP
jgi:hypothetical protein